MVHERAQEISKLMKLHIQGVWQNAHKFTRQLAHTTSSTLRLLQLLITAILRLLRFSCCYYNCTSLTSSAISSSTTSAATILLALWSKQENVYMYNA